MARGGRGRGRGSAGRGKAASTAAAVAAKREHESVTLADADAAKDTVALKPLRVTREDEIRSRAVKAIGDNFKAPTWSNFVKWEKQVDNKYMVDYIMDRIRANICRGPAFYKELKNKFKETDSAADSMIITNVSETIVPVVEFAIQQYLVKHTETQHLLEYFENGPAF